MCGSGSHKERGGTLHWCNCGVFSKETSYKDMSRDKGETTKMVKHSWASNSRKLLSLLGLRAKSGERLLGSEKSCGWDCSCSRELLARAVAFWGVQAMAEVKPSRNRASFPYAFSMLFIGLLLAKPKQKPGTREVHQYTPSTTASTSTEKDGER